MSEMRFGRHFYTDAELDAKRVTCPLCESRNTAAVAIYAWLLKDFECFDCGAIWRGGPKGELRRYLLDDICLQHDQVQEVA